MSLNKTDPFHYHLKCVSKKTKQSLRARCCCVGSVLTDPVVNYTTGFHHILDHLVTRVTILALIGGFGTFTLIPAPADTVQ